MPDPKPNNVDAIVSKGGFRWLSGWSKLFLEMLAITFGVLLAFGLNAWWQDRSLAEFDRVSLSQIQTEIDRNYDTIKIGYDYRTNLYPKLLNVERGVLSMSKIEFQGTRPPRIETAAYDLALTSGVFARIEPGKAQTFIRTYLDFENIENTHTLYAASLPNLVLQMESQNDPRIATFMRMAFMDMIFAEGETLNKIASMSEKPTVEEPWITVSGEVRQTDELTTAGSE